MDHDRAGALFDRLGIVVPLLDPAANLRIDLSYSDTDDAIAVTANEIRNGAGLLKGQINLSATKAVQGRWEFENWTVNSSLSNSSEPSQSGSSVSALADYAGTVDISLKNVSVFGQRIDAEQASVSLGDATARVQFGDGASLNNKALSGSVTLVMEGEQRFSGDLKTDGIALDRYLNSQGYKVFASSTIKGGMQFGGALNAGETCGRNCFCNG